jgi:hypothetical protein
MGPSTEAAQDRSLLDLTLLGTYTPKPRKGLVIPGRIVSQFFNRVLYFIEAMSMTKGYFTSLFSGRSEGSLIF